MTHALCQDCLRLHRLTALIPDDKDPPGLCPACRGQTCDCTSCMSSVHRLADGDFRNAGLQRPDEIISWTPDGGAVTR